MKRRTLRLAWIGLGLLGVGIGGCATQTASMPDPNFAGPTVAVPTPTYAPPPQVQRTPAPSASPGVLAPREWLPAARARPWRWIVIHHSATPRGSAAEIDRVHRQKGWDELGYHFVIGNGAGSGDGQIEVGSRWRTQKHGAHTKTADNRYNDFGIGICLVGNFENSRPTPAQVRSLERLVAHLMSAYRVGPDAVLGHNQCKPTACPGRFLSVAVVRRGAMQLMADDVLVPRPQYAAGHEMLRETTAR